MGMTPEQFFEAFVRGNYEDCQENPGCVRRAFNAAVSASHLADHYLAYYKLYDPQKTKNFDSIGNYVEHLSRKTNGCFRDIRSISNAYKHLYTSIDPKKAVHSSVSSTGAIDSITLENENEELAEIEEDWKRAPKDNSFKPKVIYTKKDGKKAEFLPTLEAVIQYWEKELF